MVRVIPAVAMVCLCVAPATGQFLESELAASDGASSDTFGRSVGLDGDRLVVGAPGTDDTTGSAYVFESVAGTFVEQQELLASDGAAGDALGTAVGVSGDVVVAGAPDPIDPFGAPSGPGRAYVFRGGGTSWTQEAILAPGDGQAFDLFGSAIAVDGDVLVVGAPGDEPAGPGTRNGGTGAAYVFAFDGVAWTQTAKLTASGAGAADAFGTSVSLRGDALVVGAPGADGGAGAVHVFRLQGGSWVEEDVLLALDGASDDRFGASVALGADVCVAGAPGEASERGAAYVFRRDGAWAQEQKLVAAAGQAQDALGDGVGLDGDRVVAGAPRAGGGEGQGVLFAFDGASWSEVATLSQAGSAFLGQAVAVDVETSLLGAPLSDGAGPLFSGSAFVFGLVPLVDCNGNGVQDAIDIATGTSADCNGNGVPDECDIASGTSADCNGNGVPDECEPDCNGNGIPDDCDIASGASEDCNSNGVPDECDIAAGTSLDCNANGVPDECEADCNSNGVPDDCDVASGTSPDCNGNGIPDECDIAAGTSLDCNGNTIPDECDLAAGTAADCNGNGVLDVCDIASGTSEDLDGNGVPDECQGTFEDLRNGLAGVAGVPVLTGSGTLIGGDPFALELAAAAPLSTATLFLGVSQIDAPFKGGVLVPAPDLLVGGLSTDAAGALTLGASWPTGVPSGAILYYQFWIADPVGPKGLSASNGLSSTAP